MEPATSCVAALCSRTVTSPASHNGVGSASHTRRVQDRFPTIKLGMGALVALGRVGAPAEGRIAMATKKKTSVPPDKLELYERLVVAAGIDSKSNLGSAYTALNGNMYSMLSKHGVVGIRLPERGARSISR